MFIIRGVFLFRLGVPLIRVGSLLQGFPFGLWERGDRGGIIPFYGRSPCVSPKEDKHKDLLPSPNILTVSEGEGM